MQQYLFGEIVARFAAAGATMPLVLHLSNGERVNGIYDSFQTYDGSPFIWSKLVGPGGEPNGRVLCVALRDVIGIEGDFSKSLAANG
jgi:hypothetical protein